MFKIPTNVTIDSIFMSIRTIILVEKEGKKYVFTSFKKISEVFKWFKLSTIYKNYSNKEEFDYKGAKFTKLPLN